MQNLDKGVVFTTEETMQVKAFGQPLYKDLTPVLDGYMEIVRPRGLPRPFVMLVNEEGRLMGLPINPIGCYWYQSEVDPIVGNLVIMKEGMRCGEPSILGLTDKEIAQVKELATEISRGQIRDLDAPEKRNYYHVTYESGNGIYCANIAVAKCADDALRYYRQRHPGKQVIISDCTEADMRSCQRRGMPIVTVPGAAPSKTYEPEL